MNTEKFLIGLLILSILFGLILSGITYNLGIKSAVKYTAKDIVTSLELIVACQQVGNVTVEQVKEQWIKTFLLNKTEGGK